MLFKLDAVRSNKDAGRVYSIREHPNNVTLTVDDLSMCCAQFDLIYLTLVCIVFIV